MDRPPTPENPSQTNLPAVDDAGLSQQELEQLMEDGLTAFNADDYETTIKKWEEVLNHDPENYRILVYLSLVYTRMGAPELARGALIRATKIQPRYAKSWNNLGNSFRETGELFRAVDAYEKAVKLKPRSGDYRYNLAITYLDTLDYEKAIEQFRHYRIIDPDDDSILLLLATAYYQTDQPQKAFNCVRVFLQRHPKTRKFPRLRAQMKLLRGVIESSQAKEAAKKRTAKRTPPEAVRRTGDSEDLLQAHRVDADSKEELVPVELVESTDDEDVASTAPVQPTAETVDGEDEPAEDAFDDDEIEWV